MAEKTGTKWIEQLREKFSALRGEFSRAASFEAALEFMTGALLRSDTLGLTSVVRAGAAKTGQEAKSCYERLRRMFRSEAWEPAKLMMGLGQRKMSSPNNLRINGRVVIVADHTNNTKEGRCMPGVRNVHQHSETSSKPDYSRAQQWGGLTLLQQATSEGPVTGNCVYLEMHRFDGELSMLERPVAEALALSELSGEKSYCVGDAAFSAASVHKIARASEGQMETLSRCRKDAVAYEAAPPRAPGQRGRAAIYGQKIKLIELFQEPGRFTAETVDGKEIKHLTLDLLSKTMSPTRKKAPSKKEKAALAKAKGVGEKRGPGRPRKIVEADAVAPEPGEGKKSKKSKPAVAAAPSDNQALKLRYFLISSERGKIILVSTDLTLTAADAYRLYRSRPAIERFFQVFKNLLQGFDSHFWSPYIKACSRTTGVDRNEDLDARLDSDQAQAALKATEGYATLMAILCGFLQDLCLEHGDEVLEQSDLWLRTPGKTPTEFIMLMLIQAQELQKFRAAA